MALQTSEETKMEGGCLCGSVRYGISGTPFAAEFCHCRMCQKSAGAVVVCWMDLLASQLNCTADKPSEYASSEHVRRGFCRECGSAISFRDTRRPEYLSLAIASLDDPDLVEPGYHIYTESQLKWFTIDDDREKFPREQVKCHAP